MQVLESSIERAAVKYARSWKCILLKIEGQMGWPDRLLLCPNGTSMFIEFKRPGESLRPLQKHIQMTLRGMQFRAEEVDNLELFKTLLQDLLQRPGYLQSIKSEV